MQSTFQQIRKSSFFIPATIVPAFIAFIFTFFSLSIAPQISDVVPLMTLGIVNNDVGNKPNPLVAGDMLVQGISANSPLNIKQYDSSDLAENALAVGEVTAILILPEDFTKAIMGNGEILISAIIPQHLSIAENQFGSIATLQMELAINKALSKMAATFGNAPSPMATFSTKPLFEAPSPASSRAPMMANSAIWLAAFVGSLMLFLVTKPVLNLKTPLQVASFRTIYPAIVTCVSSIILALTLCLVTSDFGNFISLWLFIWPVSYAIALLVTGLFSSIGFVAILALIPIVFYQPVLSGASFPVAALPEFMKSLTDIMPFSDVFTGLTSILIGGPSGNWQANALITALLGIVLIWVATYSWAKIQAKD